MNALLSKLLALAIIAIVTAQPISPPSSSPPSPPRCSYVAGSDGSFYDLTHLANQVFQAYSTHYVYNFSICGNNPSPCGQCDSPYSSASCGFWQSNSKCYGRFNGDTTVQALDNNEGVIITYSDGDKCGVCEPAGPRQTVITIKCDAYSPVGELSVSDVEEIYPGSAPILYINATASCSPYAPVTNSPFMGAPQPNGPVGSPVSDAPQSSSPVASPSAGFSLQVTYEGPGASCSPYDAYVITPKSVPYGSCSTYCNINYPNNAYSDITCDEPVSLDPAGTYVNTVTFDSSRCTGGISKQQLVKTGACVPVGGNKYALSFCSESQILTTYCSDSSCNDCSSAVRTSTNRCTASNSISWCFSPSGLPMKDLIN